MDLSPSPVQVELAEAARTAFTVGKPAPIIEGALTDLAVVAVELGRAAVPSTFHTDVLARLLGWQGAGSVAVAVEAVRGVRLGGRGLDAVADFVAHASETDAVLLRIADDQVAEIHLRAEGIAIQPQPTIGDDSCCQLTLTNAPILTIHPCDVVGAMARAAVVLAADAVGAARAALEAVVGHVSGRHQWGAPLGTLQAVQHRCADMLIDVTLAADAVFDAAAIADRGEPETDVRLAAAYAKATAIERCRRVTASAHQLAGGEGIYADRPFHRWYRRVKAAEPRLGDARSHRALIARAVLDEPAHAARHSLARMVTLQPFGRTGHLSSRVIFGAAALGSMGQERADAVLDLVLRSGINHIDTAAGYGESEIRLQPFLADHAGQFFLATKTGERHGPAARSELERSLQRLGVNSVDLIQLHNLVEPEEWDVAFGPGGAVEALASARDEGLARFIGVTGHGTRIPAMHLRSLERFDFDSVLLPYNFTMLRNGEYRRHAEALLALCAERNVAVQTIKSVARRRWPDAATEPHFAWYEPLPTSPALDRAVAYVLANPQLFLNTSSDARLLPAIVDAAARASGVPTDEQMEADTVELEITPLFDGSELERI